MRYAQFLCHVFSGRSVVGLQLVGLMLSGFLLNGCASSDPGQGIPQRKERAAFTTTFHVKVGEKTVGYLTRFDEVPIERSTGDRRFPVGTFTVEDIDFQSVGWITPLGEAFRLINGQTGRVFSKSLGHDNSTESLAAKLLGVEDPALVEILRVSRS